MKREIPPPHEQRARELKVGYHPEIPEKEKFNASIVSLRKALKKHPGNGMLEHVLNMLIKSGIEEGDVVGEIGVAISGGTISFDEELQIFINNLL
jgi:hypothetical protein